MNDVIHQMLIGVGALILGPANALPAPGLRITLPPEDASQGIAFDFYRLSADFGRAVERIEHANQLELELQGERRAA